MITKKKEEEEKQRKKRGKTQGLKFLKYAEVELKNKPSINDIYTIPTFYMTWCNAHSKQTVKI